MDEEFTLEEMEMALARQPVRAVKFARCPRCKNVYVQNRKDKGYCSAGCRNVVYMRTWSKGKASK